MLRENKMQLYKIARKEKQEKPEKEKENQANNKKSIENSYNIVDSNPIILIITLNVV